MSDLRASGRRRLVLVTAGVGVLAAGGASAVAATRPAPHHRPSGGAPSPARSQPGHRDQLGQNSGQSGQDGQLGQDGQPGQPGQPDQPGSQLGVPPGAVGPGGGPADATTSGS